jgi:O-antigen/teichoic acid export membrane protein
VDSQLINNFRRGFKGAISVYVGIMVRAVSGFFVSVILIRGLTQEEFGAYRLAGSLILFGSYICSLGLEPTILRFGCEFVTRFQYKRLWNLFKSFVKFRGGALFLLCFALLFFQGSIAKALNFPDQLTNFFPFVLVILSLQSLNQLWGTAFLLTRIDQINDSINKIGVSLLKLIGFGIVLWMGYGVGGVIKIWLVVLFFAALHYGWINWRWLKKVNPKQQFENVERSLHTMHFRRVRRFALFSFLAINVNIFKDISIDNFIVAHYWDAEKVALYGLASTLVIFVGQLNPASLLRGVLYPIFVSRYTEKHDVSELISGHTFLLKLVIFFSLPVFTVLMLLGDKIIEIIYFPGYLDAYVPLIFLSPFFFFVGLTYPVYPILHTLEKNELFLTTGIFSMYNFFMDLFLVPRYGISGAAVATGSAGFFQFFFYWAAVKWYLRIKLVFPWGPLLKTLTNVGPVVLFSLIMRPYIKSVVSLIGTGAVSGSIYLVLTYINNIFDEEEISLFKRALGRRT